MPTDAFSAPRALPMARRLCRAGWLRQIIRAITWHNHREQRMCRLNRLSDAQLARRGLQRADIARLSGLGYRDRGIIDDLLDQVAKPDAAKQSATNVTVTDESNQPSLIDHERKLLPTFVDVLKSLADRGVERHHEGREIH